MPTDFPSRLTVQRSVYDWPDGGSAARRLVRLINHHPVVAACGVRREAGPRPA
jgi:hypothetical protein